MKFKNGNKQHFKEERHQRTKSNYVETNHDSIKSSL